MASTKTDEIPSPPGVTPGGVWGKNKYIGTTTQAAACIGCLCFFLPGLCILLCPLDERDAYKVNNKVYTADGKLVNTDGSRFVATAPLGASMVR